MLLILSARPVTEEIALQFGRIPPSFLPLGSQRLFALQAEIAHGMPCYMTVPEDYEISPSDLAAIEAAGIRLLPQPSKLSITEAIGNALTRIQPEGLLRILYGDTLLQMSAAEMSEPDIVAVQETTSNYNWAFVEIDPDGRTLFSDEPPQRLDTRRVVCGYYTFSDPALLATACHENSIVKALRLYSAQKHLTCRTAENWLDFGHLPLYFQSKKDLLVKRVFNELVYEDHMLVKRSADTAKMRAEANWYEALPGSLRLHTPRYLGRDEGKFQAGYALEYVHAPLLSDLAVFGSLPLTSWLEILQASIEFISKCHAIRPPEDGPEASHAFASEFFHDMIVDKTRTRLASYCAEGEIGLEARITLNGIAHPPLKEVAEGLVDMIPPTTPQHIRFWHGDLFYGNMFYDFIAQRVLCIDPRGQLGSGQISLWGDLRYDLAKLAHSIIGHYDKVLNGRSVLKTDPDAPLNWQFSVESPQYGAQLEEIFLSYVHEKLDISAQELRAMTALMFLSMLPLHSDSPERQRHLLAAGLLLAHSSKSAK
ncbi:MAG: phosphotransferase [Pseudomonadota bacterium]